MLQLGRRIGERVLIETPSGDVIDIELKDIVSHTQARIGIQAPGDHQIYREELPDAPTNKGPNR